MEGFDFAALLQNHEKKHKSKPTQFVSVAGGVRRRLENTIKRRRSSRLTIFDSIRNLSVSDSPKKQPDPLTKVEHRRMQLEKWKEEKEQKKRLAAAQKKKPFVAGVAHIPMKFVPPPPPPKVLPSTSGRVTRSQTAKNNPPKLKPEKTTTKQPKTQSFAPKNATFKAPEIKNMSEVPVLAPAKLKNTEIITFEPVLHTTQKTNTKAKVPTQPKVTRTNSKKTVNQTEQRGRTTRGRIMDATSSSSGQSQQSSEDTMFPQPKRTRSKNRTPKKQVITSKDVKNRKKSLQGLSDLLPSLDSVKPKLNGPQQSAQTLSGNIKSPVLKQHKRKSTTPRKITQSSSEETVQSSTEQPLAATNTPSRFPQPNQVTTPRNPIPKSESSSEEKLRSPKSPVDVPLTPEQIAEEAQKNSPFVTLARGKANARRETLKKIDEGLMEEDTCDVDSVDHFRRQLDSEIKRMTEMCDTWDRISEQIVLPEAVQERVLGAVGQARLLMSHKLQQFASLVQRCARPEPGRALVTPADLHGFWDMVFMQVENVDMRFKKLEELRARNWAEEAAVAPRRAPAPPAPRARRLARPAPAPAAASRLKDVIAAARRAKKQELAQSPLAAAADAPAQGCTFEAGFFSVRSPVKAASTPRAARASLLHAVLSSEAKKSASKNSASLAMLRASLIGKEVENDSPVTKSPSVQLTPINLNATPSRSILKPVQSASTNKSSKKSIKVVLFDHSDTETHDTSSKEIDCGTIGVGTQASEDPNTDSGVSSMDIEKEKEQKENKQTRRKSLIRQNATEEQSPVMTRSRRKSMPTPSVVAEENTEKTPKRTSRRKKTLQEAELNVEKNQDVVEKTPKRTSRRKKALQEVESNVVEEKNQKRKSSSRRKSAVIQADVA